MTFSGVVSLVLKLVRGRKRADVGAAVQTPEEAVGPLSGAGAGAGGPDVPMLAPRIGVMRAAGRDEGEH